MGQRSFNDKVIHPEKPWSNRVYQHGNFQPDRTQYGCDRQFPTKTVPAKTPPSFGPWKNPNKPKFGHEKLMGGYLDHPYVENMDKDKVRYHDRSEKKPVWNPVTPGLQLKVVTVMDNKRNINKERLV